jgi:hypothetical protein
MIYQKSLCWTLRFLTANPWKSWVSPWSMICRGICMWIKSAEESTPFFIFSTNLSNTYRLISSPDFSNRLFFLTFYMKRFFFNKKKNCISLTKKFIGLKFCIELDISTVDENLIKWIKKKVWRKKSPFRGSNSDLFEPNGYFQISWTQKLVQNNNWFSMVYG